MTTKYYVRVRSNDQTRFEKFAEENGIKIDHLSNDFGPGIGTSMYATSMDEEQALALTLSFPLIGCLNFHKAMKKPSAPTQDSVES